MENKAQYKEGFAEQKATCGELVQGFLGKGKPFHVTLPINKKIKVSVKVIRSDKFSVKTNRTKNDLKIKKAARLSAIALGIENHNLDIHIDSSVDIGKGMGSSTCDILATISSIYNAFGLIASVKTKISIATEIESSDGLMTNNPLAFNQKTGEIYHEFKYFPKFNIVLLIPEELYDTEAGNFIEKENSSKEYAELFDDLLKAEREKDFTKFANCATQSAVMNQKYLYNSNFNLIKKHMRHNKSILGGCVGHTGTVSCALFKPGIEGGKEAKIYASGLKKLNLASEIEIVSVNI